MIQIDALPDSPEYIDDKVLLANALFTLEELERRHKRPYIFEYIQQPMVGGTCHPVPSEVPYDMIHDRKGGSRVIDRFDKEYFRKRLYDAKRNSGMH